MPALDANLKLTHRTVYDLVDWIEHIEKQPAPTELIKGLIPCDAAILMSGRPKISHKSWFASAIAFAVVSGKPVGMLKPTDVCPASVMWYEQEGPAKAAANRFRMLERGLKTGLDCLRGRFFWRHRAQILLEDDAFLEACIADIKDTGTKLVVFDTLAKVSVTDENSSKEVGILMRRVDKIRNETGASVLYIHHLSKAPIKTAAPDWDRDIDDDIRGSSAYAGFYDVHLAVRKQRKDDVHNVLTVRSRDYADQFFATTWQFQQDVEAKLQMAKFTPGELSEDLLVDCVSKLAPGNIYSKTILKQLWKGVPPNVVDEALAVMLEREVLVKRERGYSLSLPTADDRQV